MQTRSSPIPPPACGGHPNRKESMYALIVSKSVKVKCKCNYNFVKKKTIHQKLLLTDTSSTLRFVPQQINATIATTLCIFKDDSRAIHMDLTYTLEP